jgi:hypothetical protein
MGENSVSNFINFASRATKMKLVAIFVTAVLVVTLSLFSVVTLWRFYREPLKEAEAAHETHREVASKHLPVGFTVSYEIKGMNVGFMDRKDTRMAYAQFNLVFNCPDEACKKNLVLNHAKVLDVIFEVSSDFYIEDFVHPEAQKGFSSFKSRISQQLKKRFASVAPEGLVIQEWFLN